jgi:hypothetical protein
MPRKKSSKRINIDTRERWKSILKTVSKDEVPVELLQTVTVNLVDGTRVDIDIIQLLAEGHEPDDVKYMLNTRLDKLDSIIKDVDFYINVDSVAKTVQPVTDEILKHL